MAGDDLTQNSGNLAGDDIENYNGSNVAGDDQTQNSGVYAGDDQAIADGGSNLAGDDIEIDNNVTEGALPNIIINTATGQDLSQEIDVTLELPGFEFIQSNLILEKFGFQIADDMQGIMFYDPGG